MDQKILTIFGIVCSLVFIGLLVFMFSGIFSTGRGMGEEMALTSQMIKDAQLEPYNGTQVTGDTIISLIKKSEYVPTGGKKLLIEVETEDELNYYGWQSDGTFIGYAGNNGTINVVKIYDAKITVNPNGVIIGVKFTS